MDPFKRLEQGTMTVSKYAQKFQSLSCFPSELVVALEERKYRRFEKGLNSSVKRLVMAQHKERFFEGH